MGNGKGKTDALAWPDLTLCKANYVTRLGQVLDPGKSILTKRAFDF